MTLETLTKIRCKFNNFVTSNLSSAPSVTFEMIDEIGYVEAADLYSSNTIRSEYCRLAIQMLEACVEYYKLDADEGDSSSNKEIIRNWKNVIADLTEVYNNQIKEARIAADS